MATNTTANQTAHVKAAYDQAIFMALRPHLHFDQVADVEPTMQTQPGTSVTFTINSDLAVATTPLDESTDVDPATLSSTTASVTIVEYGNAAEATEKLLGVAFDAPPFDKGAAERIGWNAGVSQDSIAAGVLYGGSNVTYGTGGTTDPTSTATIQTDDILTAHDVRIVVAQLYTASVPTWMDGYYRGFIHPHVALDYREETGAGNWRSFQEAFAAAGTEGATPLIKGFLGEYEGVAWVQTPRAQLVADAGSDAVDQYGTLVIGRQALAKAYSKSVSGPHPQVRIRPPVDRLLRFHSVGWYWLGGYGRFREESIRRIESSSSLGTNV